MKVSDFRAILAYFLLSPLQLPTQTAKIRQAQKYGKISKVVNLYQRLPILTKILSNLQKTEKNLGIQKEKLNEKLNAAYLTTNGIPLKL